MWQIRREHNIDSDRTPRLIRAYRPEHPPAANKAGTPAAQRLAFAQQAEVKRRVQSFIRQFGQFRHQYRVPGTGCPHSFMNNTECVPIRCWC